MLSALFIISSFLVHLVPISTSVTICRLSIVLSLPCYIKIWLKDMIWKLCVIFTVFGLWLVQSIKNVVVLQRWMDMPMSSTMWNPSCCYINTSIAGINMIGFEKILFAKSGCMHGWKHFCLNTFLETVMDEIRAKVDKAMFYLRKDISLKCPFEEECSLACHLC